MIVDRLKSRNIAPVVPEGVVALYLYGSSAKGRLRQESDVDIAFLPRHSVDEEDRLILIGQLESMIAKILGKEGIRREISVLDLRGKFVSLTLQYKVITEGMLLHEKDPLERVEFENTIKREYFDFMPFLQYLRKRKYGPILQEI